MKRFFKLSLKYHVLNTVSSSMLKCIHIFFKEKKSWSFRKQKNKGKENPIGNGQYIRGSRRKHESIKFVLFEMEIEPFEFKTWIDKKKANFIIMRFNFQNLYCQVEYGINL